MGPERVRALVRAMRSATESLRSWHRRTGAPSWRCTPSGGGERSAGTRVRTWRSDAPNRGPPKAIRRCNAR